MIQPVKLDSPTLTREPAQGDSGNGGFSSMLANLVDPGNGPSRSQTGPPRAQEGTPDASPNKPQGTQQQAEPSSSATPQAGEAESSTPAQPAPVIAPQKPAEPKAQTPEEPTAQGLPGDPVLPQVKVSSSATQVPMDFPKPLEAGEPTQVPPEEVSSLPPSGLPAAMTPPQPPVTVTSPSTSDKKIEPDDKEKDQEAEPTSPVAPLPLPLIPVLPTLSTLEAPEIEVVAAGPGATESPARPDPAPVVAQAQPTAKPAPQQPPQVQAQAPPDSSNAATPHAAPSVQKDPTVSTEPLFEPARIKTKANSTQDAPTPQAATAALGLKPPSPMPALTELLSRPMPAMETPSVVQTIQEAKGASTSAAQAAPLAPPLPGIESARGSELYQGREPRSGQGAQSEAQANPSVNPSTAFTLNAPTAALAAKATVPEVAAARPSLPMEQMEGTVRWVLNNQQNSAELQLRPESLGKVQIQLKVEGTQVHAKVWASESTTVPLLESHRGMLESSLREQGLSLGSFDLRHGQGAPRHPMDQPSGQASFAGPVLDFSKEPSLELPAAISPSVFGNRRVEVFA